MRSSFIIAAFAIPLLASCASGRALRPQMGIKQASPLDPPVKQVHFKTGSVAVGKEDRTLVAQNALWLSENPAAYVLLEGHCDERGSDAFNMELGDRRARSVLQELIMSGVDPERTIMIVSQGEREPVDPLHSPAAWRKNRRVEFIVK